MFRHDDGSVKLKPAAMPTQAALKHDITAVGGKRCSRLFSKADEDRTVCLLKMRKPPAIFVFVAKHGSGHSCPRSNRYGSSFLGFCSSGQGNLTIEVTLLPVQGIGSCVFRGQECPRYTSGLSRADILVRQWLGIKRPGVNTLAGRNARATQESGMP